MKIVQINACYEFGSTGRLTAEMHEYLLTQGIESYKFYPIPKNKSNGFDIIGSWIDHKLHALLSRITGRQAYFSTLATKKLLKKLLKIQPDIILLGNLHSNFINLPLLVKHIAKNDIACVVVLHDCWFFTGYCCHYTEIGCKKWLNECNKCPLIKKDKSSWFVDPTKHIFKERKQLFKSIPRLAVIGVSDWITNEGRKSPIFSNAIKIQRIYNWIDLNIFYPRETSQLRHKLGINDSGFVALGVSILWSYKKGLDVFLEIAKKMPDIKIVMIGNMPNIPLPPNIICIPPIGTLEDLAQYYSMADVLLNLSIQETFGKVGAEALACGTPIIANNATANPEVPGLCGYVIENNNVSQIVNAINDLRTRGKNYYKSDCINRARALFDKNTNIEQYIDFFREITSK